MRYDGHSRCTKYDCLSLRDIPKNAPEPYNLSLVLWNSCVKCYIPFLKMFLKALNIIIIEKTSLFDRKDIKISVGDKK